jgi:glucan 1,3-beta-glucosidase
MNALKQFYYDGVVDVRGINPEIPIVIHDAYEDIVSYWNGFMNSQSGVRDIILDTHVYQIFTTDLIALKPCSHVQTACNMTSRLNSTDKRAVVGEWTGAQTECTKWINGLGKGVRYDGLLSGSNGYYGVCQAKYQGTVLQRLFRICCDRPLIHRLARNYPLPAVFLTRCAAV